MKGNRIDVDLEVKGRDEEKVEGGGVTPVTPKVAAHQVHRDTDLERLRTVMLVAGYSCCHPTFLKSSSRRQNGAWLATGFLESSDMGSRPSVVTSDLENLVFLSPGFLIWKNWG